jgi:hypothetical protein
VPAAAAVLADDDGTAADAALARLRAARSRLLENGVLDPGLARMAAVAIGLVLERQDRAAMVALRRANLRARNELIRDAAARFYSGTPRARAISLLQDADRYAASGWRHHRAQVKCPPELAGSVREILWHMFKTHPRFPTGIRQLQAIIG